MRLEGRCCMNDRSGIWHRLHSGPGRCCTFPAGMHMRPQ